LDEKEMVPMTEQDGWIGGYIAGLPYLAGHELGDKHVVFGAFKDDGRVIVHGTLEWEARSGERERARQTAGYVAKALEAEDVKWLVVVGYGPEGPARSQLLATELERSVGATAVQIHVHDGTWRKRDGALSSRWGPANQVPNDAPDMVLHGRPRPAPSRAAAIESVGPLESALFEPMEVRHPDKAASLNATSPALRADVATGALEALAAGPTDDPVRMQVMAHLISSDLLIRDAVLAHALRGDAHDERVAALVRTFRAAPPEQRPALATTAATAAYLAAWSPPIVLGLLKHADTSSPLVPIVASALRAGINPRALRTGMVEKVDNGIREADEAWTADRSHQRRTRPGASSQGIPRRRPAGRPPRPAHRPHGVADIPGL
jgi:hypothetical protein